MQWRCTCEICNKDKKVASYTSVYLYILYVIKQILRKNMTKLIIFSCFTFKITSIAHFTLHFTYCTIKSPLHILGIHLLWCYGKCYFSADTECVALNHSTAMQSPITDANMKKMFLRGHVSIKKYLAIFP